MSGWSTIAQTINADPRSQGLPDTGRLLDDIKVLLPPGAMARYLTLRDAVDDGLAVAGGLSDATNAARLTKDDAAQRLRLLRRPPAGFPADSDHPALREAQAALDAATTEHARLTARQDAHHAATRARGALLNEIDRWLRSTARAGSVFAEVELVDPPKLLKGEDHRAAVERLRRRLRELDADRHRIESAPFPSAVAKQAAAAQINALADAAAPHVGNAIEHGGPLTINGQPIEPAIVLAKRQINAEAHGPGGVSIAAIEQIDAAGLLAWLFRDEMIAKIGAEIDGQAEDGIALTAEQRREQLSAIAADRDVAERGEAFLIFEALAAGIAIEPRGDHAPAAFLGIAPAPRRDDDTPAPRERTSVEVVPGREREVIPTTRPRAQMAIEGGRAIPPSRGA